MANGKHPPLDEDAPMNTADESISDLEELENFAKFFKARRVKLGKNH